VREKEAAKVIVKAGINPVKMVKIVQARKSSKKPDAVELSGNRG
jgi:hypothetical protein